MKQFKIIREVTLKYKKGEKVKNYKVSSPADVYEFLKDKIADEAQENLVGLYLNNKNDIQCWALISRGTVSETIAHPREVFKYAVMTNSSSVVIAHNHPSNDTTPSMQDIQATRRLVESGDILGIGLLDHVIITENGYLSMKENGYM